MIAMDGVLCVDKPAGCTSHDVVARVRRTLGGPRRGKGRRKVGHAGTLDPDATGLLVVCLGKATRLVPWLQASRKTYEATMRLGRTTTTLDAAGEVVAEADASEVTEERLCAVLHRFTGPLRQRPPMVSAVKIDGERLYEKARRGEDVDRAERDVFVHDLVLEDFEPGPAAAAGFLVTCSAGTYVRTLAADIGDALEVGAHLTRLRRVGSGRFSVEDAVTLAEIDERAAGGQLGELVGSMAEAVADYPSVVLGADDARAVGHGRALDSTGQPGPVAALDGDGRLLAMLSDDGTLAKPQAVFAAPEPSDEAAQGARLRGRQG